MAPWHLSTDIYIERGAAPGAGFADSDAEPPAPQATSSGDDVSDLVRLRSFVEAANSAERFLSFAETLSVFAGRLAKVVAFDSLALYIPRRGALAPIFVAGNHRDALASLVIPVGKGVSGWAAGANRPILNGNPAVELCHAAIPCPAGALASVLALPLSGAMGPVGVLSLYSARENAFHADDLKLLAGLGTHLASYLEKDPGELAPAQVATPLPELAPAVPPEVPILIH
jgi:GAF domain-containing protein